MLMSGPKVDALCISVAKAKALDLFGAQQVFTFCSTNMWQMFLGFAVCSWWWWQTFSAQHRWHGRLQMFNELDPLFATGRVTQ